MFDKTQIFDSFQQAVFFFKLYRLSFVTVLKKISSFKKEVVCKKKKGEKNLF